MGKKAFFNIGSGKMSPFVNTCHTEKLYKWNTGREASCSNKQLEAKECISQTLIILVWSWENTLTIDTHQTMYGGSNASLSLPPELNNFQVACVFRVAQEGWPGGRRFHTQCFQTISACTSCPVTTIRIVWEKWVGVTLLKATLALGTSLRWLTFDKHLRACRWACMWYPLCCFLLLSPAAPRFPWFLQVGQILT